MDDTQRPTRLEDATALESFLEHNEVALVEFYTSGCSKCQAMEPILGNVARATGISVGLVNPGDDIGLVERFDIRSVPTLVLFESGEERTRWAEGVVGAADLVAVLEESVPEAVSTD